MGVPVLGGVEHIVDIPSLNFCWCEDILWDAAESQLSGGIIRRTSFPSCDAAPLCDWCSTGDTGVCATTGDTGVCATTGDRGERVTTGDTRVCATTDYTGVCASTGDTGVCTNTWDRGERVTTVIPSPKLTLEC